MWPSPVVARAPWSARLILACFMAVSVSLPVAWISLAKVLLLLAGLAYAVTETKPRRHMAVVWQLWSPRIIVLSLLLFSLSALWSEADAASVWLVLLKHLKLLEVVLLIYLLRSAQEARTAVMAFALGQTFVLLSSWLLFLGVPVPWTTDPVGKYVVFSTYLDQSIFLATSAAIFWHLRNEGYAPRWLASALAVLALVNVLLLLDGRGGYVVALAMLALAVMWVMPARWRLVALVATPVLALAGLTLGSAQVQQRVSKIWVESQKFSTEGYVTPKGKEEPSSAGWRLNAWRDSLAALQERPWIGHGVGAWTVAIRRIEGDKADEVLGTSGVSNPHQEFLLWGVELGVSGILLALALLLAAARDARNFPEPIQRATLSVLLAIALACLFNSALYDDLMGDFLCVSLGLLLALGVRSAAPPKAPA